MISGLVVKQRWVALRRRREAAAADHETSKRRERPVDSKVVFVAEGVGTSAPTGDASARPNQRRLRDVSLVNFQFFSALSRPSRTFRPIPDFFFPSHSKHTTHTHTNKTHTHTVTQRDNGIYFIHFSLWLDFLSFLDVALAMIRLVNFQMILVGQRAIMSVR